MSTEFSKICAGLALCLIASTAPAQQAAEENPRESVRRQFQASGLEIGSQFPDVQIFDAEGKPFQTADLRGSYTVLVTGCLT